LSNNIFLCKHWAETLFACTDDLAIAQAINEIEQELQEERGSLFKPENMLAMDLNDIDSNLKSISPTLDDYAVHATGDAATAEGARTNLNAEDPLNHSSGAC
jgi:predicted RNA-binding protein with EMAP domain